MTVPIQKQETSKKPHVGLELLALARKFSRQIPLEEFEKLPKDGADEHDHYLYGTPKRCE